MKKLQVMKKVKFRSNVDIGHTDGTIHTLGIPYQVPCFSVEFNKYGTVTCDGKVVGRNIGKITVESGYEVSETHKAGR